MHITRAVRQSFLSCILVGLSGAVQAAYPTPGASEIAFEVHPVPMLDAQKVLEDFLSTRPSGEYSLVADRRTGSIVAVAPPEIQGQLTRYLERRLEERMKRFVVDMKVTQMVQGRPREIRPPRQELPYGETGVLNLNGAYREGGADWRSRLSVRPEPDASGRIKLHIRAAGQDGDQEAVVTVSAGEHLLIDEERALHPELRELARQLNSSQQGTPYSVSLRVQPL